MARARLLLAGFPVECYSDTSLPDALSPRRSALLTETLAPRLAEADPRPLLADLNSTVATPQARGAGAAMQVGQANQHAMDCASSHAFPPVHMPAPRCSGTTVCVRSCWRRWRCSGRRQIQVRTACIPRLVLQAAALRTAATLQLQCGWHCSPVAVPASHARLPAAPLRPAAAAAASSFRFSALQGELVVAGVYVRLYVQQPAYPGQRHHTSVDQNLAKTCET